MTQSIVIGKDYLYIKRNASKCNYIGIGLKWANYKVKNLSPIIQSAAIELRVRVDSGSISKIPMFFILEDYAGKQCRANVNYLNLEGKLILNGEEYVFLFRLLTMKKERST